MKNGKVEEFDTPLNLIQKSGGLFASMIDDLGEDMKAKLIYLAHHKELDLAADVDKKEAKKEMKHLNTEQFDAEADGIEIDDVLEADDKKTNNIKSGNFNSKDLSGKKTGKNDAENKV